MIRLDKGNDLNLNPLEASAKIGSENFIEKFSSDRYCERIIEALRRGKVRQDDKLQ